MPDRTSVSPRTRLYALTSNGDWMEMTPRAGESQPEVAILAVEVESCDELLDAADQGYGELRGRLVIKDGKPVLEPVRP